MKKGNLLNKLLMLLVFVFGVTALNAQVMVDTTGDGNFVDEGATVTQAENFAKVIVENGGTLNTNNSGIGVLIIEEGGTVAASVNLNITDTILVQGTLNMNSRELYVTSTSIGYYLIASTALVQNAGTFKMRQSSRLTNHLAGLTIPTLDFNSSAHFATVYVEGDEMVTLGLVRFSNNRDGCMLSASQDIKITTGIDFRQGGIINPNDNNLLLGTNFKSVDIGYINHNGHPYFFDLTGGGNIIYSLAAGMQSDLPPLRISGLVTNLVFDVNDGAVLGASPALSLSLKQNNLLPGVKEQVTKTVEVAYINVTTPDFKIKYDFNTTTDVVGDTLNLFYANLNPDSLGWVMGDALSGDTVVYSGDIKGIVTARGSINTMAQISVSDTLTESTLDSAVIALELFDAIFLDATLDKANFTLSNAPVGVTIDSVVYLSATTANVILAFDKTNFDTDVNNLKVTISALEIYPSVALTSDSLYIKAQGNVATLSDLTTSEDLTPAFDAGTFSYAVVLPYGTTATPVVTPTLTDANASYDIDPASDVTSATEADRTTKIVVNSEDMLSQNTYSIVFSIAKNNDTTLSDLAVDGVTVTDFDAATQSYNVSLASGADSTVTATPTDVTGATLEITQATAIPGTATVVVTAEDGTSTATYTINFTVVSNIFGVKDNAIKVWPVPASTTLNVETPVGTTIQLVDMLGNVVYSNVASANTTIIDVNNLSSGTYVVKVANAVQLIQVR